VIGSVSSETALGILESVHDSPKVSTELADELGMTTQNARYHLDKLEEAGLIEVEDICYSEKGRVMSVYKPAESPLLLVFGRKADEAPTEGVIDAE
jgi:predicted ArsR family transcriptional regulator